LRIRSPIAISPLASLCGCQAGRLFERGNPAEPDDPNSSSPDPNVDGKKEMCKENSPCPLHFYGSLFWQKAILWPGSRGVARKKHRREKYSIRRSPPASSERGGPVGDPPDRPYADSTRGRGSGAVPARAKKWNAPHDFSAQRPCFLAGQPLKFNRSDANLAKSEGGQEEFAY
jgi:hypothetical protein